MSSGNVWKRPNGTWEYRFEVNRDPLTGKRRRSTRSGFTTRREAQKALREAMASFDSSRFVERSTSSVRAFLEEWHPSVRSSLRPSTWANYGDYMRAYVIPHIGDTRLQELTARRLNTLYGKLLTEGRVRGPGGLAPKTVQNVHRMLHRALSDAVRWELLPRNVAEDAQPPRVARSRLRIWTPEQLRDFVNHVQNDRFAALWLLACTTGIRRGELAGLELGDVDLQHGRIAPTTTRVTVSGRAEASEPKTDAGRRSLALDPMTWSSLANYIEAWTTERRLLGQHGQLLFVWPDGRPLHPDTITALFRRHCETAGLPVIRLHDVRHSYATAALRAGMPPKVISERLGHATVAFTLQTYAHVIPAMDEQAAAATAAYILGTTEPTQPEVRILGRIERPHP